MPVITPTNLVPSCAFAVKSSPLLPGPYALGAPSAHSRSEKYRVSYFLNRKCSSLELKSRALTIANNIESLTNHTRRRRFGVDLARFFLGRPPFLPFSLAALAFASEVEAPPFAPPFVPQFRNISSTAFGSKSLIDLIDFFFVTSAILAR